MKVLLHLLIVFIFAVLPGSGCCRNNYNLLLLGDKAFEGCTSMGALVLPKLPTYLGENVFAGWGNAQAMMINQSKEELLQILHTGIFKGCSAIIYDKDFTEITIDPETGLAVNP